MNFQDILSNTEEVTLNRKMTSLNYGAYARNAQVLYCNVL